MKMKVFQTKREFNKTYPGKMFICPNCNNLTNNPKECQVCGWRADGLFKTQGKGLKFKIEETGEIDEIFQPIENFKQ